MIQTQQYDISHLKAFTELANGPIQSDEALFLYSLVRVMRPKVIVEFGFFNGNSANNFLKALPKDSMLYSFDCEKTCEEKAREIKDSRFKFVLKRQQDLTLSDIDGHTIDLLFIDASHDCDLNIILFEKVKMMLSPNAIVAIHDTGTWNKSLLTTEHSEWKRHINNIEQSEPRAHVNAIEFAHQPDERRFTNYLKVLYPEFQQIHFHTLNTTRHGLTILQRYRTLSLGTNTFKDRAVEFIRNKFSILFAWRIKAYKSKLMKRGC